MDPLAEKYPNISPYAYVLNNPVNAIDPDGRKIVFAKGVSKEFKKAFAMAIKHLKANKADGVFAKLQARKETFTIEEVKADGYFDPNTKTIGWDPNVGLLTDEGVVISATTILNHEGDHALQQVENLKQKEIDLANTNVGDYDNNEEKRVIDGSEQRTAKALGEIKDGEVTRKNHKGDLIETTSPTSNNLKNEVIIIVPKKETNDK